MTRGRFGWLCGNLRSSLAKKRARIPPEVKLAISLRYLAGGSLDIREMWGIRTATFFQILDEVIPAAKIQIVSAWKKSWKWTDGQKIEHLREIGEGFGFAALSGVVFGGCIGCIDGLCLKIIRPALGGKFPEIPNPANFFNRKGFYALTMQGVCDAQRQQLRSVSIICPGRVHDSLAHACSTLAPQIRDKKIPSEMLLNGDDAYSCSEQMVTPYPGKGLSIEKDGFDFHQSKVLITVECAFGMLHARWGVLWKPISLRLD